MNSFVSIDTAAYELGVPSQWLRAEAEAGRVPAFRAGRRTMCDLADVRQTLSQRKLGATTPERETATCA